MQVSSRPCFSDLFQRSISYWPSRDGYRPKYLCKLIGISNFEQLQYIFKIRVLTNWEGHERSVISRSSLKFDDSYYESQRLDDCNKFFLIEMVIKLKNNATRNIFQGCSHQKYKDLQKNKTIYFILIFSRQVIISVS